MKMPIARIINPEMLETTLKLVATVGSSQGPIAITSPAVMTM